MMFLPVLANLAVLSIGSSIAAQSFALWTHAASTTAQNAPEIALVQSGAIDEGPRIGRFAGSAFCLLYTSPSPRDS